MLQITHRFFLLLEAKLLHWAEQYSGNYGFCKADTEVQILNIPFNTYDNPDKIFVL